MIKSFSLKSLSSAAAIFFGIALSILFVAPVQAHAEKTVTWSTTIPQALYYAWDRWGGGSNPFPYSTGEALGLSANTSLSVTYRTKVTNYLTGQEVPDGSTLPVGTLLLFQREAPQTGDVSWFGTGSTMDSPYGYFVGFVGTSTVDTASQATFNNNTMSTNSSYTGSECDASGYVGTYDTGTSSPIEQSYSYQQSTASSNNGGFPTFIDLDVSTPAVVLSNLSASTTDYGNVSNSQWWNYSLQLLGMAQGGIFDNANLQFSTGSNGYTASPGYNQNLLCENYCTANNSTSGCQGYYGDYYDSELCEVVLPLSTTTPVTGATPFSVNFDFSGTSASFYYHYYDSRTITFTMCGAWDCETITQPPGCYGVGGNGALGPISETPPQGSHAYGNDYHWNPNYGTVYDHSAWINNDGSVGATFTNDQQTTGQEQPPFNVTIPPQQITYNFYVTSSDTPPYAPTVTGPTSVDTSQTGLPTYQWYTAVATDSDAVSGNTTGGNKVRYGIDWNSDGIVDQWVPAWYDYGSSYYDYLYDYDTSGQSQQFGRQFTQLGTTTFQILAQDDKGALSPWTSYSTLFSYPNPTINLYYYGGSSITKTGTTTYSDSTGDSPYLYVTTQYADNCDASGAWTASNIGTYNYHSLGALTHSGQYNYSITCHGQGGTTTQALTVNVTAPLPSVSLQINGTGDTGTAIGYEADANTAEWYVQNAASCTASASPANSLWSGSVASNTPWWTSQGVGTLPAGNYTYSLACQNMDGVVATDTVPLVIESSPLQASCNLSAATEQVAPDGYTTYVLPGSDVTYTASALGGSAPYTYSWDGYSYDQNWNYRDDGLSDLTDSTIDTTYSTLGDHYANVTVTDAAGATSFAYCYDQYGNDGILVDTPPPAPVVTGPIGGVVDTDYTFSAQSTPDDNVYYYGFYPNDDWYPEWYTDYGWYESATDWQDSTPNQINDASWSTPGTYTVGAVAFDPYGLESAEGYAPQITITDGTVPPDTCSADVNPASTGQVVTWSVATSSSTPSFSWAGDVPSSALYQDSTTYSTTGTKSASVIVTSNGISHDVDCGSIAVNTGLPQIDLSGSTGAAYTYGSVVLSKTAPLQVKLSVSNAISCSATGDELYDQHIQDLTNNGELAGLSTTPDVSGITSPLSKSETLTVTCSNANGSASATLRVGLLSITEF